MNAKNFGCVLDKISRRDVVIGAASLTGLAAARQARAEPASTPFGPDTVSAIAKALAAKPYVAPDAGLPAKLAHIDYSVYAKLQFQATKALWRQDGLPFQVQFFPRGYLYRPRVDIFEVIGDRARPVGYAPDLFANGGLDATSFPPDLGFSGFRLHAPINDPDYEEFAVFQGASYFRAVANGEIYGLSARGLAIGSGEPHEEFPQFTTFWLERPALGAKSLVIHALLDSPSVAGAYRFRIQPGMATVFDVEAVLYPRRDIANAGLAPMSSMFFLGDINRYRMNNLAGTIHDSQGLEMWNGRGERLWRPLDNPQTLEIDAFADKHIHGFGLIQRDRRAEHYHDIQQYERRPSLWIEPQGDWGAGHVELLEITSTDANADNMAAFWRPARALRAGVAQTLRYRMSWGPGSPVEPRTARVFDTGRFGPQGRHFQIVYRSETPLEPAALRADVTTTAGAVTNLQITALPEDPAYRGWGAVLLAFDLDPAQASQAQLRAHLLRNGALESETWIYRWSL
jgi:glucans biosynthesis protein